MGKAKYGPNDLSRFCGVPANMASITPNGTTDPQLGSGKIGKVQVSCRFLHQESKWGVLEYKQAKVPAGIIHMEISFRNLHTCVLESAKIRVALEGEHYVLQKYRSIAHKLTGQRTTAGPVEVKQHGPVSLVGTPFGISSQSVFAFNPTVEAGGISGSMGEASLTRQTTRYTRWVFEGSTSPGKASDGTTVNTIEWTLNENVQEGQPSHGNCFRTAFVFTNDGKPFIIRVGVEGSLRGMHRQAKETITKGLKFGGSRKDAVNTLVCGFEYEKQRLNERANSVDKDMIKANGAIDYYQRLGSQAHVPEAPPMYEDGTGRNDGAGKNRTVLGNEGLPYVQQRSTLELAMMMSQPNIGHSNGERKGPNNHVDQLGVEAVVKSPKGEGRVPDVRVEQDNLETTIKSLSREQEETMALAHLLLLLWQEILNRIHKLLTLGGNGESKT